MKVMGGWFEASGSRAKNSCRRLSVFAKNLPSFCVCEERQAATGSHNMIPRSNGKTIALRRDRLSNKLFMGNKIQNVHGVVDLVY